MGKKKPNAVEITKQGKGAEAKAKASRAPASASAAEDMASIFATIATKQPAPGKLPSAPNNAAGKPDNAAVATAAVVAADDGSKSGDGVFRSRPVEDAMQLGDDVFFGEAADTDGAEGETGGAGKKKKRKSKIISLFVEPGMRVVSENQFTAMTRSKNPNAGATPNCPFDCDCCF
jgi:hypothetical protein